MKHRNVIIFGASQGIGKALAYEYSARGAKLILLSRNTEALSKISSDINSLYMKCDITNINDVKNAIEYSHDQFGYIDLVIINSGVGGPLWIKDFTSEKLHRIYEVNILGTANVFEFIIPIMKNQQNGTIAGISSLADSRGYPGSGPYSSTKAALSIFLESARIELKKYNIKIITVRPGFVRTAMTEKNEFKMPFIMSPEKAANKIRRGIESRKSVVQFPLPLVIATWLMKFIPPNIFDFLLGNIRTEPES